MFWAFFEHYYIALPSQIFLLIPIVVCHEEDPGSPRHGPCGFKFRLYRMYRVDHDALSALSQARLRAHVSGQGCLQHAHSVICLDSTSLGIGLKRFDIGLRICCVFLDGFMQGYGVINIPQDCIEHDQDSL